MLRETRARWLATATAAMVVLLAALFALLHNPRQPAGPVAPAPAVEGAADEAADQAGYRAFSAMNCTMCHSLAGQGNPASRLDGVGGRLDREAIRAWTVGEGPAREALGASMAQLKSRYSADPQLDTVVEYLARQR
jgi:mono/diheme cytochrome c family protein